MNVIFYILFGYLLSYLNNNSIIERRIDKENVLIPEMCKIVKVINFIEKCAVYVKTDYCLNLVQYKSSFQRDENDDCLDEVYDLINTIHPCYVEKDCSFVHPWIRNEGRNEIKDLERDERRVNRKIAGKT